MSPPPSVASAGQAASAAPSAGQILHHKRSSSASSSSDDNDDVVTVFQCNCQNEHNHDNELDDNARVPTIDDFIKEIKCSGILADAEKSRQLLLLIQMYFQVQDLNVNSSTENVSEGSENFIKLPPL